jgi:hypothetical protein
VSRAVNQKYEIYRTNFVRRHLLSWRCVVEKHRRLRATSLSNWAGYANFIMSTPFLAWKAFASTASVRRVQQDSLVNAYVRWKARQKHIRILRAWRHQSLYGGVEGMYSRTNISRSLGEQKSMGAALQKMITKQTIELEECRELVNKETVSRKRMEDKVGER